MGNCCLGHYALVTNDINDRYKSQHESIQKLTIMIQRLDKSYNYYREQCFLSKSKAIAFEQEGHDTIKALHFVKVTQNYETAMKSIIGLENLLLNVQLKLRLAVETSETMEILKDETAVLKEQLDKIYNETKVIQTLNSLESQLDRAQNVNDLIKDVATSITDRDKRDLQDWCKNRYTLLKEFQPEQLTQDSSHGSNYYSNILTQETQQTPMLSKLLEMIPNSWDTFFPSPTTSKIEDRTRVNSVVS